MKRFVCDCGRRVFFDNTLCGACGRLLGFDPVLAVVRVLNPGERYCRNYNEHCVCNWLVSPDSHSDYCVGCERTEVIPALDVPGNVLLWSRLEAAKRRLLYSLITLGLSHPGSDVNGLPVFRFLEDQRRNPAVFEEFVLTGHASGTITINLLEADDAARHAAREEMQERYRTLLGHFRHEAAHYFFPSLVQGAGCIDDFRACFGDERQDYQAAMNRFYAASPITDWQAEYVSAYASAHPHEDWAETFAHYLHIRDALETAESVGLAVKPDPTGAEWISEWIELSVTLNELNRSLGADDAYPFVLTLPVIEKLSFVDRRVRQQA